MKRAEHRTDYILIKAHTNSEWDNCEYAVIKIEEEWLSQLWQREKITQAFKEDFNFLTLTYCDSPEGYYNSTQTCYPTGLLMEGESYCFVVPEYEELENLPVPENQLDAHELVLDRYGNAQFRAYGNTLMRNFIPRVFLFGNY